MVWQADASFHKSFRTFQNMTAQITIEGRVSLISAVQYQDDEPLDP